MGTSPALLSVEHYLRTSYHPDVDFVDGELIERHKGEYEHNKIQTLIAFLFTLNAKAWATDAVVEQRIRVSPDCVRICDVVVLRAETPRAKV